MKEEFKVSTVGDIVYAFGKTVFVYKEPSVNTRLQNLYYAGDDPSWNSGDVIGTFEGTKQKIGSELWLKVIWNHKRRRVGLFNIRGQYTVNPEIGWVLDKEVSKASPLTIEAETKAAQMAQDKADYEKLMDELNKDKNPTAPKSTLGNSLGITKTNADGTSTINYINITIYVGVLVSSLFVFFKFFKPKK